MKNNKIGVYYYKTNKICNMIEIFNELITFREVPWEISYTFFCKCTKTLKCKGCSWADKAEPEYRFLEYDYLKEVLKKYSGKCTCITFLSEGGSLDDLNNVLKICKNYGYKTCLYTGYDDISKFSDTLKYLDYIKFGSFKEELGGLYSPKTNQEFWVVCEGKLKERIFNYELWS